MTTPEERIKKLEDEIALIKNALSNIEGHLQAIEENATRMGLRITAE